jgi:hypothetical protein
MERFFEDGSKIGGFMCFAAFMVTCAAFVGFFVVCLAIDWWAGIRRWWNRKR